MNNGTSKAGISVIIPVYNTEQYLQKCIESVLYNIEENDEIIIIDDGSTDNSAVVCRRFQEKNANIIFVSQKNMGLGCTRNRGMHIATKEYVIFLDSDDYWKDNLLAEVKKRLAYVKSDIVYFDAECMYEPDSIGYKDKIYADQYRRIGKMPIDIMKGETFFAESYPEYFIVSACMAVFRKEFLFDHKIAFQEGIYFEDNIFSLQAMLEAAQVQYIPEQLYVRRYRAASIMVSGINLRKLDNYVCMLERICEYILRNQDKCDENILWKLHDFPYRILDHFIGMERKYQGKEDDFYTLEIRAYRAVFSLAAQRGVGDCVSGGRLLNALLSIERKDYCEALINESFAHGAEDGLTLRKAWQMYQAEYKKSVDNVIRRLPIFEQHAKIGIYGGGSAAGELIKRCERIGRMADHICIIESDVEGEKIFLEKYPVVSIKNIGHALDIVIISSYRYQREMLEMAKKYLTDDTEIILLHDSKIGPIWWKYL